ncbi:MAG TPA: CHASE3 domain-containing protein [Cyclobacteriaceae bacterium]|nr:CHASE3 domain-containing protein [Cyclobacteriaceae bacterium]
MANVYIERKLLWGFVITVGAVLALSVYAYLNIQRFIEADEWQDHTREVVNISQQILSGVTDMETAQRGFVITADEKYLQPYYQAHSTLDSLVRKLFHMVEDNSVQEARVSRLRRTINNKSDWVATVIDKRRQSFEEAQKLVVSGVGLTRMDEIRNLVDVIQQEEDKLYSQRKVLGSLTLAQFQSSFASMLIVAAVFVIILFFLINSNMKARIKAELQLKSASAEIQDLYNYAPCGYLSVDATTTLININQTLLDWMGYTASEVLKYPDLLSEQSKNEFRSRFKYEIDEYQTKGYVNGLEFEFMRKDKSIFPVLVNATAVFDDSGKFLKSRTTVFDNTARKDAENRADQLRKEMEAFTYSVSHDLRAPLRFIGGYAQMLEEDYKERLDAEGNRILATIQKNAERMGHLIDDLLDFSRMGRKELMMATINFDQVVSEVLEEFQLKQAVNIEVTSQPLGNVRADRSMIKQVWINLISNAIKYSRKQPISKIEIGRIDTDSEIHFYVKDNGVGFDMQYSHKLFEVFQRLHKVQEFEGTGVGLALVKRIVVRHGGRVWAASRTGEGAIFYFSLPNYINHAK